MTVLEVGAPVTQLGDEYFNTTAKGTFVPIKISVENIGKKAETFWASNFKLIDDQEREFEYSSDAMIYAKDSASILEEINPGTVLEGALYFDVPADANIVRAKIEGNLLTDAIFVELK